MIRYVVTEEAKWSDPDDRYLNVRKGTVCGIYQTKELATRRINQLLDCTLYSPFRNKAKWIDDNHAVINVRNCLYAKFAIHEHHF